jgi:hypothetical protein
MHYNNNIFPSDTYIFNSVYKQDNMYTNIIHNNVIYEYRDLFDDQECFVDNNVIYIEDNFEIYQKFRKYIPMRFCPFQFVSFTDVTRIENQDKENKYIDTYVTYQTISNKLMIYLKNKYNISTDIVQLNKENLYKSKAIYAMFESKSHNYTINEFIDYLKRATDFICYCIDPYLLNSNFCKYITELSNWLGLSVKIDNNKLIIYNIKYINSTRFKYIYLGNIDYVNKYVFGSEEISLTDTFDSFMSKVCD